MADSMEEVLRSLIDTLNLCGEKVKEGSLGQVMEDLEEGFSLEEFWMKLGMTFRAVSKEATKLTVSFSKPRAPSVDNLQCLLTEFETSVIAMLTVFRSLPLSQAVESEGSVLDIILGQCLDGTSTMSLASRSLHKKLQDVVTVVLEDCQELATSFLKEGCTSVSSAKTQSTGKLWEHCDALHQLPKDNKKAVMAVLQSNFELIKDALSELEEAQKCNGYQAGDDDDNDAEANEQGWSSEDKLLVPPCVGLVKVCRHCVKNISGAIRTSGQVTSVEDIQQLDAIAEEVQKTSPNVDDIVTSLYSPVNHEHLYEAASRLASQLREMLNKTRNSHFTVESDSAWLDFLNKAVDHNLNNFTTLVRKQGQINT